MKTKQISSILLVAMIMMSTVGAILFTPASSVSALSKQDCYDLYNGIIKAYGNKKKDKQAYEKYKNDFDKAKCGKSKGGNCKFAGTYDASAGGGNISISCTQPTGDEPEPDKPGEEGAPGASGSTNKCANVDTAIIKCNADNSGSIEKNGIWALLLIVINIMTAGVGVLAVGGIVYGAILYTTAEDRADQLKKATDIITNVVIGLIAFALMWAGLNFIIPGGVFS